jgi:outer membrane receptor protein involved in Fe transport
VVGTGTVVYDQAYFADYDVQNAQDMLRRIPGVSSVLASLGRGAQDRGFGSGGGDQILLDGRRFPGKANDTSRTLSRLRADRVQRVELIRGGRPDIDVQSTGLIVNIVLREGAALSGGGTFEIAARGNEEGAFGADGLATYASSVGRLGYNFGIERSIWSPGGRGGGGGGASWTNRFREEIYLFPDGNLQELRPRFSERDYTRWVFTGGTTYDFSGGARAQLNGLYETSDLFEVNTTELTRFDEAGVEIDRAREEQIRDNGPTTTLEISSEFTSALLGGDLTILLLGNRSSLPTFDDRIRIRGDRTQELSRSETDLEQTELIGRVQYSFPLSGNLGLSVGGEAAQNKLRQDLSPSFDVDGDGTVEPVVIPTANARVEEIRGEVFVETRWDPTSAVSVNGSLIYEYSELTTNSIFNAGRNLAFLKPRVDVRYTASSAGVFRLLADRQVSQLQFRNFVPRYNFRDDRIDAGNPGLLPERTWNLELGYEHRLPNDLGVVSGMIFYQDIKDPIDAIPLWQGAVLVSAEGNLDHATRYGAELEASMRLVPLGLRDAVLTLTGELMKSAVTDPFTGEPRRLNFDSIYEFTVGYRHDVRSLNLSYGFDYFNRGASRIQSDLFSRELFRPGPGLSAFAEKRLSDRFALRSEAQNLVGGNEYRERVTFATNQIDGTIGRLENYREFRDLRYALILKGTF